MADDVMKEIENEIRNNKVMIYMKGTPSFPQCGFSAATIEIFQELGKPFHTVDVLSEPEKRDAIKRFSNWPTIPQVYVERQVHRRLRHRARAPRARRAAAHRRRGFHGLAAGRAAARRLCARRPPGELYTTAAAQVLRGGPRRFGGSAARSAATPLAAYGGFARARRSVGYSCSSACARSAIRSAPSSMPTE